jgi:hypothetical protein
MIPFRVLIFGSGSLVKSTCYALSASRTSSLEISLAARSTSQVSEIVAAANIRSRLMDAAVRFAGFAASWEENAIEHLLARVRPDLVLHAASLDSPWRRNDGSLWADLISRGGFGISLPLQAALVTKVARVMAQRAPGCPLVNASYPDAVNPVLNALGLNVLCGVGNVGILAAVCEEQATTGETFSILAHHSDVSRIATSNTPTTARVRLWSGDTEIEPADTAFDAVRQIRGGELNQVTGATIAKLLQQLARGESFRSHVPGPNGLPGGYPVQFSGMAVSLDLPAALTHNEAIAHNQESAKVEGVFVEDGIVNFVGPAAETLREFVPDCPTVFPVSGIDRIAEIFGGIKNSVLTPANVTTHR